MSIHCPPQALTNSTAEYETLESEVSALHDELWEQLGLDSQVKGPRAGSLGGPRASPSPWGPQKASFLAVGMLGTYDRPFILRRKAGFSATSKVLSFRIKIMWIFL